MNIQTQVNDSRITRRKVVVGCDHLSICYSSLMPYLAYSPLIQQAISTACSGRAFSIFQCIQGRSSTSLTQQSRQSGSRGRLQKRLMSPFDHILWYLFLFLLMPCFASYLANMSLSPGVFTLRQQAMAWLHSLVWSLLLDCHTLSYLASWSIRVSTALVSKTLITHVSIISQRPIESCRQSWNILTILGSTITFLRIFLDSQKVSKSASSFMCQISNRKVLRPLLSCTISTNPPFLRLPSKSTPSTLLLRM